MLLTRPLHLLGYALLFVIGLTKVLPWPEEAPHGPLWLAGFLLFCVAYAVAASVPAGPRARQRRVAMLGVQAVAMLGMSAASPCCFASLTLVIVAWQVAALFGPGVITAWLVVQTAVLSIFVAQWSDSTVDATATVLEMLGFQAFAAIAVAIARRESAARDSLGRVNAELRATRALLAESSRADERTRIARDLHDVMGHELTALALQLEVARNLTDGPARQHVTKARAMGDRLLDQVRDVVGAMRGRGPRPGAGEGMDLGAVLRDLVQDTPGLRVHLDLPAPITVDDGARAQCVVRCVQEIVTNTLRHAHARNLWIAIRSGGDGLAVDARDDGGGAPVYCAGNGLRGMQERIEDLGGWLQVHSPSSRAFALSAWLPTGGGPS
jgi:signal transduction histidine kinase